VLTNHKTHDIIILSKNRKEIIKMKKTMYVLLDSFGTPLNYFKLTDKEYMIIYGILVDIDTDAELCPIDDMNFIEFNNE
jgi:hypothetical protein